MCFHIENAIITLCQVTAHRMQDRVLDYVRAVSRVKSVLIRKHASGHSIQEKVPAEQGGADRLVLFKALLDLIGDIELTLQIQTATHHQIVAL